MTAQISVLWHIASHSYESTNNCSITEVKEHIKTGKVEGLWLEGTSQGTRYFFDSWSVGPCSLRMPPVVVYTSLGGCPL